VNLLQYIAYLVQIGPSGIGLPWLKANGDVALVYTAVCATCVSEVCTNARPSYISALQEFSYYVDMYMMG
jgi:hypothetical protein